MQRHQGDGSNVSPRAIGFETFKETLTELFGQAQVSESKFGDAWLRRLNRYDHLSINGWYDPPPNGLAVLFAKSGAPERLAFESLRLPRYWPSDQIIDWADGLLYAYCSPVDLTTGALGDFGVTLYFGSDTAVRQHFAKSYHATRGILESIRPEMSSRTLFEISQRTFDAAHVTNTIASITDTVPLDLGHTLPVLPTSSLRKGRELQVETRQMLRTSRKFISVASDWPLRDARWFTVEPQLVSSDRPGLPQISYHYVVEVGSDSVHIYDECDELLRYYRLTV